MSKKTIIILLFAIVSLGAMLRLYHLGSVPPSPDWDEVSLAYNAHSLFTTGRDEYGNFLPAVLRSYNDYKPAFYAYMSIPSVEIFGLTSFAIRLPSAVMGILAILIVYFLVKTIFRLGNYKEKKQLANAEIIALLAAFLLAISPWHIQFSRIAFETNTGLTFNFLVALLFIKGLKNHWLLVLSMFLAGLNLSVYQSERVFTPLLVLALVVIFRKELFTINKKILAGAVFVGIIALIPPAMFLNHDSNALLRVKGTSIFNDQTELLKKVTLRLDNDIAQDDALGKILDNRRVTYTKMIAEAYISHYNPKWLFLTGDNNRHHAPGMGLIYIVFLPFILIGIYQLIFGNFDKKTKYLIFSWFLLAPIPASITTGVPHAVRTLNFAPTYEIFIALGIITAFLYFSKMKYKILTVPVRFVVFTLFVGLFIFNFVYYLNQYFGQQNYAYAYDWQYGYDKAVPLVEELKKDYKTVIVSDREPLTNAYMFFLFYMNYPADEYQKINVQNLANNNKNHSFDKYEFYTFEWDKMKHMDNVLLVGGRGDFPDRVIARKTVYFPNGEPAIYIVDPKDNR